MSDDRPPIGVQGPTYGFAELRSTGLLWLINASVFHPRGLALALHYDDGHDQAPTGWSLIGAGEGEPFTFGDSPEIDELFQAAEITMSLVR